MLDDPLILRGIERILAVAIGGLSIYFGYRLFFAIPGQRADGRAELTIAKDKRLLISRIAPGTFFALFGVAVLVASYYFPVTVSPGGYSGLGENRAAGVSAETTLAREALNDDEVRQSMAFLTDAETALVASTDPAERDQLARHFRNAKLAIMGRAWREDWGDPTSFGFWLDETPPRTTRPEFERALAVLEARE